ncbi:MAG: hypothetical protein ACREBC_16145 [Pyrinomonadaceae bacterium]
MILKERHTKALRKKADRGFVGYPVATVAYYGPDDKVATKVAVGIISGEDQEPAAVERRVSGGGDLRRDHEVNQKILLFIRSRGAKSVVLADRSIGCPHEEGIDSRGREVPAMSVLGLPGPLEWRNRALRKMTKITFRARGRSVVPLSSCVMDYEG